MKKMFQWSLLVVALVLINSCAAVIVGAAVEGYTAYTVKEEIAGAKLKEWGNWKKTHRESTVDPTLGHTLWRCAETRVEKSGICIPVSYKGVSSKAVYTCKVNQGGMMTRAFTKGGDKYYCVNKK